MQIFGQILSLACLSSLIMDTTCRIIANIPAVTVIPISVYQCMKNLGQDTIIIRTAQNNAITPNALQNINNARNAGLTVEL